MRRETAAAELGSAVQRHGKRGKMQPSRTRSQLTAVELDSVLRAVQAVKVRIPSLLAPGASLAALSTLPAGCPRFA